MPPPLADGLTFSGGDWAVVVGAATTLLTAALAAVGAGAKWLVGRLEAQLVAQREHETLMAARAEAVAGDFRKEVAAARAENNEQTKILFAVIREMADTMARFGAEVSKLGKAIDELREEVANKLDRPDRPTRRGQ